MLMWPVRAGRRSAHGRNRKCYSLVKSSVRKRSLLRSEGELQDNIKIDIWWDVENVGYIYLTTVRLHWWTHMNTIMQGCTSFPKILDPLQNSRHQNGGMKHVAYREPTKIRRHSTKFIRHGELAPNVCASATNSFCRKTCLHEVW
jgi:hypothetical protein